MSIPATSLSPAELQKAAREHLWLHFTRMSGYVDGDVPIIVRGDGCYLEDANGKRYLDALAGLFAVNIGYGFGEEMGEAAAAQMRELPFYTNWSYAHPRAIELAAEVASLAPGDLNRVFFVSGGSEAVESAWKLARQYYTARGERRWKAVSRRIAYHGTTMGALSLNAIASLRAPFEPLVPDAIHVWNTNRYHRPPEETEAAFTAFLLEDLEEAIIQAGPETVAMVIMEPVQNAGGSYTPPEGYWKGVRDICDRHDILLCADEVITAFGRLGAWFGSERYDIKPDLITCAKGLSSAYAAIGAVIATDRVMEPFLEGTKMYSHGITFGGHPVQAAIALKNIEIMKRERIVEHVADKQDGFRSTLAQLLDLPIAGDLRGTGFFYALELVKDKETRETFSDEECESLHRASSSAASSAGQMTAETRSCRSRRRSSPTRPSSTRSPAFWATSSPRRGGASSPPRARCASLPAA
jgi:adenosylmethionine-8-amino-7-oxononanoate aminotransferase